MADSLPTADAVRHSPEDVRAALARCFLRNGADRPQWLADLAVPVVREVLEERDAEIKQLTEWRDELAELVRHLRGEVRTAAGS